MYRIITLCLATGIALPIGALARSAEPEQPSQLTIDRIYSGEEFKAKSYSAKWLDDDAFARKSKSDEFKDRHDIVQVDAESGKSTVLVAAADLIPEGGKRPLAIDDYAWSEDREKILIFTNTKRVWRRNTRGDYWVVDLQSKSLRQLGGDAPAASLMFAKFSPKGDQVAYVRQRNIYVESIQGGKIQQLTRTEHADVINGTSDWVYEEEFSLRDGFRWSPDGASIAYWQLNTEGVPKFPLVNNLDSLYPTVRWFAYPKVGQTNPICRVGVVSCKTGETRWISLPGDPREHYAPRMQWAASPSAQHPPQLLVQQLNRLQNTNRLFLADAENGRTQRIYTERDDAWVDVHDELFWIDNGKRFTWISDQDGWRHVYAAPRGGGVAKLVTPGDFDVIRLLHADEEGGWLYFIASPENAAQRYLYRVGMNGRDLQRVTPANLAGTNSYQISPNARYAIHRHSTANSPPRASLIGLPDHRVIRRLEENADVREKYEQLSRQPTEFFRVEIGNGVELDAWCIKPPNMRPGAKYPLLVYVYGEPAGQTVVDRWGGDSYLWHLMLAQQGYVVMSFDNRGTNSPRGRQWRKSIYQRIGVLPPKDQAAAVRRVLKERPYLDRARVGVWGWSGGGSSSLQAIFKYPDLYSTAIAVAPVPDQRYYDTIYQERYMRWPDLNPEGFRLGTAINYAKNLKGNLLLVHGTADDNCHYQTTEMLIDELIAHNKQFSMMAYPNRTHSVRERKNTTRHLRTLMTRYLQQHLPAGQVEAN